MSAGASTSATAAPLTAAEAALLFEPLSDEPALIVAVSGGPDSVALLGLLSEWARDPGPALLAVTVDHGLRPAAADEARHVGMLCAGLGVAHRIRIWDGDKPAAALQERARDARYRLLAEEARLAGATAIVTAHSADDQAETVLMRMAAGSSLTGLAGMARRSVMHGIGLARPLLAIAKSRLIATCVARDLAFVKDPSNDDPRFTRIRWRRLLPHLAAEGLTASRIGQLARRLARSEAALAHQAKLALDQFSLPAAWPGEGPPDAAAKDRPAGLHRLDFAGLCAEPDEIVIRVLALALAAVPDRAAQADAGPRLGRLEDCAQALGAAAREGRALRRTLGGLRLSLAADGVLTVAREGARRRGVHLARA